MPQFQVDLPKINYGQAETKWILKMLFSRSWKSINGAFDVNHPRAKRENPADGDFLDQQIKLLLELIEAEPVKPELLQLAERLQNALRDRRQSGSD